MKVTMFSQAESVKGQGVGSAYREQIEMLTKYCSDEIEILINDYQPTDISHYHTINFPYYLSTFLKKKRGVTVGYVHFLPDTLEGSIKLPSLIQKFFGKYVLSFYKRMDHLVVVNPVFGEELKRFDIPAEKIHYIPNSVSLNRFYEKNDNGLRAKYGFRPNEFIVLGVGQIQKRKGIDDFVQLAQKHPEFTFVWAGGFSFGQMTDGYEKYQKIYDNPPKNLKFTGIIDRELLNDYYNIADVFLLPSFNELFPMSILEAFNCGTPVVVRELDLYRPIIQDYALLADGVEAMSERLVALSQSPELIETYQAKSRQARDYYAHEAVAKQWRKFYRGVLLNRKK
ncbi:glycosyltransferase family 4 protein [Tuanshanicoccus yangjingiae]|uniref:glycosyltransferase family 4 protein n=1 Tax=Aerococcaceae bacterium zg-252 TaxID=2796928 RepID=UPI0040643469